MEKSVKSLVKLFEERVQTGESFEFFKYVKFIYIGTLVELMHGA